MNSEQWDAIQEYIEAKVASEIAKHECPEGHDFVVERNLTAAESLHDPGREENYLAHRIQPV